MLENVKNLKNKRTEYYYNLFLSFIEGSSLQNSETLYLSKLDNFYGYYYIDDSVFYYDENIKKLLIERNISSYVDSSHGLIVTLSEYNVENQKK